MNKIPSWAKEVEQSSHEYRKLCNRFPDCSKFYKYFDGGDYYTKASATYYDQDLNELYTETYNFYG